MATMIASMGQPSARPSEQATQTTRGVAGWCWGLYLALIIGAELVMSLWSMQVGVAVHLLLLVSMPIHGTFVAASSRALLTVMTLAPLIRIVNLAMPVGDLSPVNQYLVLSVPLAVALLTIVRVAGLNRSEIGLRLDRLPLQLGIGLLGLPIGALIYAILQPPPPLADPTWNGIVIAVLVFLVSIGFLEEVIFRGALQTVGERTLGPWTPVYVSALFAALHIGYLSPPHTGFVFLVGLIFARLAALGRSVVGVALAHGLTNVVVYLVFPLVLVRGGWTLPDVSWTGYSSSATIGRAAAPSSSGFDAVQVGVGPTPVSRQPATASIPTAPAPTQVHAADADTGLAASPPAVPPTDDHAVGANVAAASPIRRIERPIFLPRPPVQRVLPAVPATERVRVMASLLVNVRALPGLDADVVTTAEGDTILEILGVDQDADGLTWRHVRLDDGRTGWIASELLEADAAAPAETVLTEPGAASDDR